MGTVNVLEAVARLPETRAVVVRDHATSATRTPRPAHAYREDDAAGRPRSLQREQGGCRARDGGVPLVVLLPTDGSCGDRQRARGQRDRRRRLGGRPHRARLRSCADAPASRSSCAIRTRCGRGSTCSSRSRATCSSRAAARADGDAVAEAWNFGPEPERDVHASARSSSGSSRSGARARGRRRICGEQPHEAGLLEPRHPQGRRASRLAAGVGLRDGASTGPPSGTGATLEDAELRRPTSVEADLDDLRRRRRGSSASAVDRRRRDDVND